MSGKSICIKKCFEMAAESELDLMTIVGVYSCLEVSLVEAICSQVICFLTAVLETVDTVLC